MTNSINPPPCQAKSARDSEFVVAAVPGRQVAPASRTGRLQLVELRSDDGFVVGLIPFAEFVAASLVRLSEVAP